MKVKWIMGAAIAVSAAVSLYFIIKLNLEFAILSMLVMFTLTNAARAVMYKNQGLAKESKWMLWLSMFFAAGSIGTLIYIWKF